MREPTDDFTPIEERMVEWAYIGDNGAESDIRACDIIRKYQSRGITLEDLCASLG